MLPRPSLVLLGTSLLGACVDARPALLPEPSPGASTAVLTVLELASGRAEAHAVDLETYRTRGLPVLVLTEQRPRRVWLEFLAESLESLRVDSGRLELSSEPACGVRDLPRGTESYELSTDLGEFTRTLDSERPSLLLMTPCQCPAPEVHEVPVGDYCRAQPLSLPDGRVLLSLLGGVNCGASSPDGAFVVLDPGSPIPAPAEALPEPLSGGLVSGPTTSLWGTGAVELDAPTRLLELDLSGDLRVVSSTDALGQVTTLAWEVRDRTALALVRRRVNAIHSASRLYRVDLDLGTWTLLGPRELSTEDSSQADVILTLAEQDLLVFPRNTQSWLRVTVGEVNHELPRFDDLGRIRSGLVSSTFGALVGSRSGALLRVRPPDLEPLPYERGSDRSGVEALLPLPGSVGFLNLSGRLGRYRADEPRCPSVMVHPDLDAPRVATAGEQVVVTGHKRERQRAAVFLITPTD